MQPPNRPNREHAQNPTEYSSEHPRKQLHTTQASQTVHINPFQNVLIQQLPVNPTNYPLSLLAHTYPNEITTYHTLPLQPEIPSKNLNNPLLTKRSFETLENSSYELQRQRLAQQSAPSNNVLSIEELITRNYLNQQNLSTAFVIHPQEIFPNQSLTQTSTALPMNFIQPLQTNLNLEIQNPAIIFNNQFPLQNVPVNISHEIVPKIEGHFPPQRPALENTRPPTEEISNNFLNNIKKEEGLISESSENNPILRLQEAGNRITEMLMKQNMIFQSFENRNNALQKSLYIALEQTKEIRESLKNYKPAQKTANGATNTQIIPQSTVYNSNISITPDMLVNHLYNYQTDFEYNLILREDLKLPLYRGRNFGMEVLITDRHGTPIKNPTRIPLVVSIYTSENPPQHIEINNSGNKVLKGTVEKYLVNGIGYFEKVQIIEVTSHLRNGWIFLMIHPKGAHTLPVSGKTEPGQIDFRKVRPLVIDKVIVKAKRLKEKDTGTVGSDDVHKSPPESDFTS